MGIIGEVEMGSHRMEVGLLLRKAILTSSLLFSAEAWSAVTDAEIHRLEQVDTALLKSLVQGHSKTAVIFHHLETGTLKLRHILMKNRLLYHHHIVSRDDTETIKKIYNKQKQGYIKGDWYELLLKDFKFIGIELNESEIKMTGKQQYKKKIKELINKAAFIEYSKEKSDKFKLNQLQYKKLQLQPYLAKSGLSNKEINLLYSLQSRSHPAKSNYKKIHNNHLLCIFGCLNEENQQHIFESCQPLRDQLVLREGVKINDIYGDLSHQKLAISSFIQIEEKRLEKIEDASALLQVDPFPVDTVAGHILPGGLSARTRAEQVPDL